MRVVFTGGGTGGHFYPIIAVKEALSKIVVEKGIKDVETYYFSTGPYNEELLEKNNIIFKHVPSGKFRRYSSKANFIDIFKIAWGVVIAFFKLYRIYPDVVFGKGGFASLPTVIAARILKIPIMIHESDTVPGKVNKWAGMFAKRIAVSYGEASEFFPEKKVALTGQPIRDDLLGELPQNGHEKLGLSKDIPVITVLGGSQGAQRINDIIIDTLPELLKEFQIVHQTGQTNYDETLGRTSVIFEKDPKAKEKYKVFPYLSGEMMKTVAGATDLFISRSGSIIFEIANWGTPCVLVPIPESISRDQRTNAFAYARAGGALVIEEQNLTTNILMSELRRIMSMPEKLEAMKKAAKNFSKTNSAHVIASEIINISMTHEY